MNDSTSLVLSFDPGRISIFFQLLESGFIAKGKTGSSVRDFLCNGLSIGQDYLDGRIQTIFLDGKPVDNVDAAVVKDGSTLSLSAAMPGLVGATMRRGGVLSGMRSGISYTPAETGSVSCEGKITIKLFNLISRELGPEFLKRGIIIAGSALSDLFAKNREAIGKGLLSAEIDGVKGTTEEIFNIKWENKFELLLKVI
ncbi:MAG: hypothetical protein EHM30_14625 [Desulfobacteraceae bacterium]|nr:MAG: hypothetical protein EHM30_14625 [Desulfobacteraceae bacterium]